MSKPSDEAGRRVPRPEVMRLVGLVAAAVLWALSLTERDDVGLLAIVVLVGWCLSALLTGLEVLRKMREPHDRADGSREAPRD